MKKEGKKNSTIGIEDNQQEKRIQLFENTDILSLIHTVLDFEIRITRDKVEVSDK